MRNIFCMCICLLWSGILPIWAQHDAVLLRIDGTEVLRSEFEAFCRMQSMKGDATESERKACLNEFVDRCLQLEAAKRAGLDTLPVVRETLLHNQRALSLAYLHDDSLLTAEARRWHSLLAKHRTWGRAKVCHIYYYLPQNISPRALHRAEVRMDSIYQALKQAGDEADFEQWAVAYSDEKQPFWVEPLQMPVEFEQTVSSLHTGEFSRPFFTPQGLHIVKLMEIEPCPTIEEVKHRLLKQLEHGSGAMQSVDVRVEQLKPLCGFSIHEEGLKELRRRGTTAKTLFTLGGRVYDGACFAHFASSFPAGVDAQFKAFVRKSVLDEAYRRLPALQPEVRQALNSRRDSLLLAEVTTRALDERGVNDPVALKAYYEAHRSQYHWKQPRFQGIVLHGTSKKLAKRARKLLKELPMDEWQDAIRLVFNTHGQTLLIAEQGTFAAGDNVFVDEQVFKKRKKADPLPSHPYSVVLGQKIKGPVHADEVGESLLVDFRSYLYQCWKAELRTKVRVEIDSNVLKTVNYH